MSCLEWFSIRWPIYSYIKVNGYIGHKLMNRASSGCANHKMVFGITSSCVMVWFGPSWEVRLINACLASTHSCTSSKTMANTHYFDSCGSWLQSVHGKRSSLVCKKKHIKPSHNNKKLYV